MAKSGADPYRAYGGLFRDVNTRLSADVIIRQAAACWPQSEIAFEIAQQRDPSESAVKRAVDRALKRVERQLKFVVILQISKSRDPASITFAMQGPGGTEYPPVAVAAPIYLRDVLSGLDPNMPPAAMYSYDVYFPIAGSPGYPPIDTSVSRLGLVVRDGESEATEWFNLPRP